MNKVQQQPQMYTKMENWRLHSTCYVPLMPATPRHMIFDGNEIDYNGRPNVSSMAQFFAKPEADEWKTQRISAGVWRQRLHRVWRLSIKSRSSPKVV